MKRLTGGRRMLLGLGAVGVLALWVYYAYLIHPLGRSVKQVSQELQRTKTQVTHIEQAIALSTSLRQETERLRAALQSHPEALPSFQALPRTIESLSSLANQQGVKIQSIVPQRSADAPAALAPNQPVPLYREVPIQIEVFGGFHQFGALAASIESAPQPMRISALRITSSAREPRRHAARMTVIAFFRTAEEAGDAPAGAVQP